MADITAAMVKELRELTGLGMMECKKYLTAADGNLEAALDAARKAGVKGSLTERAATEGRVETLTAGSTAVAVEVVCNTDFTAKSDVVAEAAKLAAAMRGKVLVDLRNVYSRDEAEQAGLAYFSVGRGKA